MNRALLDHLGQGATTLCHLWRLTRQDGLTLGFTDHDRDLQVDGLPYRADAGLSASALQQSTGLSVDNSEALGVLSDDAVSADDLMAGRFDGAEVRVWLVNWQDLSQRHEVFRGQIGEVTLHGAAFKAELRGLAERLGQDQGRSFSRNCAAILGDAACGVDLSGPGYTSVLTLSSLSDGGRILGFDGLNGFDPGWFSHSMIEVLDGPAKGLSSMIRRDRNAAGGGREVELWQAIRGELRPGDQVRLTTGCDKQAGTCRLKFGNFLNFRGFPHLPSEDWLSAYPRSGERADGGSLFAQAESG